MAVITTIIPKIQRVYLDKKSECTITCPNCKKSRRRNFARYTSLLTVLKVKCDCGCAFGIIIDQRKYYRKNTKFNGNYTALETHESGSMVIQDLSFTGIGFRTRHSHNLQVGDFIELRFILDDQRKSEVCKKATVKRIRDKFVGAEFYDDRAYE